MGDHEHNNVSWGSMIKGAAIAAGVVAAIAIFPATLGAVGAFIAANPVLSISTAAFAGGLASRQWAAKGDNIAESIDKETFALREDTRRMEALMAARMQAVGMATGGGMARG